MATRVTSANGRSTSYHHKKYICDNENDILTLPKDGIDGTIANPSDDMINDPCSIGSLALVCATSELWILSPSNKWVKFSRSSGTGIGVCDPNGSVVVVF